MDKMIVDQLTCCHRIIANIIDESYVVKSKDKQLVDIDFIKLYSCFKFLGEVIEGYYKINC